MEHKLGEFQKNFQAKAFKTKKFGDPSAKETLEAKLKQKCFTTKKASEKAESIMNNLVNELRTASKAHYFE